MNRKKIQGQVVRLVAALYARTAPATHYVKRSFIQKTGMRLDLEHSETFSEKLQWLKLYYRHPEMPRIADKYAVKSFVSERLGEDRSVKTVALFDSAEDITLKGLPSAVALKATHGSGWNIISFDKDKLDEKEVQSYFRLWLGRSYYVYSKEWAYKKINPRVVCEPLLMDNEGRLPLDYKVFCFGGKPTFVQVDFDRFSNHTRAFYSPEWVKQDFTIGYPLSSLVLRKPDCLPEMLRIAEDLSIGFPFLRVDFYINEGHVYVGELTFYPGNGMERFSSKEWDLRLGDLLVLPSGKYCVK